MDRLPTDEIYFAVRSELVKHAQFMGLTIYINVSLFGMILLLHSHSYYNAKCMDEHRFSDRAANVALDYNAI